MFLIDQASILERQRSKMLISHYFWIGPPPRLRLRANSKVQSPPRERRGTRKPAPWTSCAFRVGNIPRIFHTFISGPFFVVLPFYRG